MRSSASAGRTRGRAGSSRVRVASAIAVLAFILSSVLAAVTPAQAADAVGMPRLTGVSSAVPAVAEIPDAITSVTVDPTDPKPGETVKLSLEWAVPDSAVAGDTFRLELPAELKRITTAFDLTNSDGVVVAHGVVSNGAVTFTLTDIVDTQYDVHGSAYFWAAVSPDATPGEELVIRYGESTTVITVGQPDEPGTGPDFIDRTKPDKAGFWWDPTEGWGVEGDYLYYAVMSPAAPAGGFQTVTVEDHLGPGQQYHCGGGGVAGPTIRLFEIDPVTGAYTNRTEYPASKSVECDVDRLTVTVDNVPENWLLSVEYRVEITDASLASYTNSATVTAGQVPAETGTTVERSGSGGTGTSKEPTVAAAKAADPPSGTVLSRGQTVTYTITFDHTGTGPANVDYTDYLGDVLDDADFGQILDDGGLAVAGPADDKLRITGAITADTAVTYTVVVKDVGSGDNTLRNFLTEGSKEPGDPATEHPVRYVYVEKVGAGEAGRLDGAVFVLRADVDGQPGEVLGMPSLTEVEAGLFVTSGIEAGIYWLEEQKAPEGFQLLAAPVRFEVGADGAVTLLNPADDEAHVSVSAAGGGMSTVTVTDRRAFALPLTGGSGATVFWISGGALLMAAAGYVVARGRPTSPSRPRPGEAGM